ncbi:2-succinyl-5-enolpyruvyl-6-hydroxy-3-cyclohexene-1-carboxylic-acid synthase [Cryobacterium psychrophilum]|uniref:2-succinyl-5-enolpyruvyl-6-hydroxy-3-cyclohexene-1-carboxylate synthase n=1 Tax=Cryobacterium psychrophilum TaxID=41988 RepID=A0A4Y8KMU5_9MICO|nr:2-succinyl-5-enolpyruvyl-6-hydroxy-3-cyclohexene-1-carboxylic-acid synthase [Cryobacterium psychrophilum]TDW30401.1 2-succinyl-5-enolpyruvyl-6-hydroxy-3-cyclohexene-1-carboxylate synthase [Cryobacterium psychrophilum]TFD79087.1 2-succinyl-5-enolpyruvyl-6-hydroxy-3-cyclohexene-1-carboxylic-acid synthase [Cryobacterium psychrophilum]
MPESFPSGSPATDFSFALLTEFVRLGVRQVVLSPGARSQALALACAELERLGRIRLHVRIDERGAGFLALGLAVETGRPALVITTSGTAVANLHPAVLEAHHSGVPLILLTADRPSELRGIRSNQTTVQTGIFGVAAHLCLDVPAPTGEPDEAAVARELALRATDAATGRHNRNPGPVQLNLAFREPLSAAVTLIDAADSSPAPRGRGARDDDAVLADSATDVMGARSDSDSDMTSDRAREDRDNAHDRSAWGNAESDDEGSHGPEAEARAEADRDPGAPDVLAMVSIAPGLRTVVIAGHGSGPAAEAFARAGGWPLLAEVSSGAHFGPNLVVTYRELLRAEDLGGRIERAIVFGHPTLSREVPALIGRFDVETVVVAPTGAEWYNPAHAAKTLARAVEADAASVDAVSTSAAREWLGRWVMTSRQLLAAEVEREATPLDRRGITRAELAALRAPLTRPLLVDAVWRASWPHDRLVLGASRLIREADRRVPGKKISVHANRGLAGIDGTMSTAMGIALASQGGLDGDEPASVGVTRLLLGDLTLFHDVGSLLLDQGETPPRLQVIVGVDGGGTIFDGLEVSDTAPADAITRVLYTPRTVDLAALASAFGWEYTLAATRSDLEQALTGAPAGPSIVEVPLAR